MSEVKSLLVIGAGIAGITAALEAAEAGAEVILVEREAAVGGRVLRLNNYFPKMCPPSCGMEINTRRLERNPRIRVLTGARVTGAEQKDGGWAVVITSGPAWVNDKCTACGDCESACTTEVNDPHNLGMSKAKAIRLPHPNAWPNRYVFDRNAVADDEAKKIADACTYGAIDLDATESTETVEVNAVVVATGWKPYPIENLEELGGGFSDVIANVQMERMAAVSGPTGGKIKKSSNGEAPTNVAFVQCAGSRDVNHLNYCSGVCCLASLKQAQYVKEQLPEAEVTMYYIDRRTPGRNEDFLLKATALEGVKLTKGKVGRIEEAGGKLKLHVEDVENETILEAEHDLVVLATGMVPNAVDDDLAVFTRKDDDGFVLDDVGSNVTVAGVARRPEDVAASVRDATGAAARALVAAGRRA
ncbi:MAG: CoB--CoM heterodisulfide reductase iron-sulfur subunit A family protein [Acidobacteria bacterium]|nr:CoB--CoM heterodisulfide reductase iron-sulfur subunit A family protein [Candidatus Sulfomarinibacter kjeldsenii]MBD3857727.1 CoB--CoM heterodisulfide reductase iron-sulfur subunit A family protein [Candidatus Sulfomarinibacter kjeldsenii]